MSEHCLLKKVFLFFVPNPSGIFLFCLALNPLESHFIVGISSRKLHGAYSIMKPNYPVIILALLFLCCICMPAGATLREVTVKGTVATLNPSAHTITIDHPLQYGCSYPAGGVPVCTYTPMSVESLTGTAPNSASFAVFKPGDSVVATSLGGAGGTWIALAKLYGSRPNEENVTALEGDPSVIPTPLLSGYAVDAIMTANCSACTGRICTAASSEVKLLSNGMLVQEHTLLPGQDLFFNGKNDGSSISVVFRNGETSGSSCGSATGTGRQAISVFSITVVPPVGFGQTNLRTATTTRPEEALATPAPLPPAVPATTAAPVTPAASSPLPTTRAGMQPLAAIGAAGLSGLVLVMRKN
jgi:hypothetical protein